MPSFEEFRHLHLFSAPAIRQWVHREGPITGTGTSSYSNPIITDSILSGPELSVPFWWLLHKISFSVQWNTAVSEFSWADSVTVEFTFNESPNDKICRFYLDDLFVNLIYTDPPNIGELIVPPSGAGQNYFPIGSMEAFQCDKVHANFVLIGEENGPSSTFYWYVTSADRINWIPDGITNWRQIFQDTFTIELPNGQSVDLNAFCDLNDQGYGEGLSASTTMALENVEWFEL